MLIRIFTLRFSEHIEGFDDEHVRNFMINNNIISIREHFFQKGDVPYRGIMLVYQPMMESKAVKKEEHQGDFRDRVVHHAICNYLEPIFEKMFIYDSYACRKEKGAHKAVKRVQFFCRKSGFF